jgi:serine protease Do
LWNRSGFFVLILSQFLVGCSGCSNSGIRERSLDSGVSHTQNYDRRSQQNSFDNSENTIRPPSVKGRTLGQLFKNKKSAVFLVYTSDGSDNYQGSGFFVNSSGLAVSNYHLFEGTLKGNELIQIDNGNQYKIARVIEKSEDYDYIIFQVKNISQNNYFDIAGRNPEIGDEVWAIGNPRGLEHTLSIGIISGFRKDKSLLQTTAEITHGSSGGALLNMNGEIVGITTMGFGEANLNFAININKLGLERFR